MFTEFLGSCVPGLISEYLEFRLIHDNLFARNAANQAEATKYITATKLIKLNLKRKTLINRKLALTCHHKLKNDGATKYIGVNTNYTGRHHNN